MALGSQTFSQLSWKFYKWKETMGEQAEGLKALLTVLGGGEPQFPQSLGCGRSAAGEAAPHPFFPRASPAGVRTGRLSGTISSRTPFHR